jgi:hypothetical protein
MSDGKGRQYSYVYINEGAKDRVPGFTTSQSTRQNVARTGF